MQTRGHESATDPLLSPSLRHGRMSAATVYRPTPTDMTQGACEAVLVDLENTATLIHCSIETELQSSPTRPSSLCISDDRTSFDRTAR
jgi:hypothetical protein